MPKKPDLLEWRIDFFEAIGDTARVIETARAIRAAAAGIPVLLTRRNVTEGGQPIAIAEPQVVAMYVAACEARCVDLIDYELSNDAADLAAPARGVGASTASRWSCRTTTSRTRPTRRRSTAKFARAQRARRGHRQGRGHAQGPADVLTLLAATWRASQALTIPLISMSMGGIGSLSRMIGLGLRLGGDLRRRQVQLGAGAGRDRRTARRAGDVPQGGLGR